MIDMPALLQACAPSVSPVLMRALVRKESAFNPYAIGMDAKHGAVKQPTSLSEAVVAAKELANKGRKFSVGLAQIHISNVSAYNLNWEQAFDPCTNLATGQTILWNFYNQAVVSGYRGVSAVWAALRGYNSGSVHKSISNDYANTIFDHMKQPSVSVTFAKAQHEAPAKLTAYHAEPVATNKRRHGESLDFFEKDEIKDGF